MKTIYFIRHGESETNAGPVRVGDKANLTNKGIKQAKFMAKRCTSIPSDVIISSTQERARQTAEIINNTIKKPIEYSDLFVERRRPSEQTGIPKDSPESKEIDRLILENWTNKDYHYSDEENFEDLRGRAWKALKYLEDRPEENIIVVTHGFFLRIVISCMMMGKDIPVEDAEQFINKFMTENTGLTIIKYDSERKRTPWYLWTWNDHAHLGDA